MNISAIDARILIHFPIMRTDAIHKIHLIGICGTGMASLAAMLQTSGFEVTGSDEGIYPPMSDFLAEKRIPVYQGYSAKNLQPAPDLVVVGNALSRGNPEIEHVLDCRIPFLSFPETLKTFFLRDKTPIVVTGTHGKTTTTSMISWGLHAAGLRPNFLIGGIAENFRSSYGIEGGTHFVVEGDEYDSAFFDKGPKFLHYLPYLAVIGNVEFDHADIYADLDAIKLQFRRLVNLIPGTAIWRSERTVPRPWKSARTACAGKRPLAHTRRTIGARIGLRSKTTGCASMSCTARSFLGVCAWASWETTMSETHWRLSQH